MEAGEEVEEEIVGGQKEEDAGEVVTKMMLKMIVLKIEME